MRLCVTIGFLLCAPAVLAGAYDVHVLGEVHDNPEHHAEQARRVTEVAPRALVFEMLTEAQAAEALPELRGDAGALGAALGWAGSGWPDFDMYYPIFAAAPEAHIFGAAVPRDTAREAMTEGAAAVFAGDAAAYGLAGPLEAGQQAAREALQMAAHCDALPEDMLPLMVEVQRLRDATLALKTVQALEETGGPVAVITGNGHARKDWGMPHLLAQVVPGAQVFVLLQGEDGAVPEGGHDAVAFAPAPDRDDPCDVFR